MLEELLNLIEQNENPREALSRLREALKEPVELSFNNAQALAIAGLMSYEDPKSRKNAALLLGDVYKLGFAAEGQLGAQLAEALWSAYKSEQTNFVKEAYIKAMSSFDCSPYTGELKAELQQLQSVEVAVEDLKHNRKLRHAIEKVLSQYEIENSMVFHGFFNKHAYVLEAEPYIRKALLAQVNMACSSAEAKECPLGVRLVTDEIESVAASKLYNRLLVAIRPKKGVALNEGNFTRLITQTEFLPLLKECFGEAEKYNFHLTFHGYPEDYWHSKRVHRAVAELEEATSYRLINAESPSKADVNIQVHGSPEAQQDGQASIKLYAYIPAASPNRFAYKTVSLPTSMSPVVAAQLVELARPYFKEDADVLDPFSGMGTLLMERMAATKTDHVYGIDTYGEAIKQGRAQAEAAGKTIYFINRDYFDFTSEYLMDEIITEPPRMENKPTAEVDAFYKAFFEKSNQVLKNKGIIFLLSTEEQAIKRQLRLQKDFTLLRQLPMRKSENIFIIEKR